MQVTGEAYYFTIKLFVGSVVVGIVLMIIFSFVC